MKRKTQKSDPVERVPARARRYLSSRTTPLLGVAGMLLIGTIGALMWITYDAQTSLRRSARLQLGHDTERLAEAISYYFSERSADMAQFAEGREISAFFENKALGMSMAYGLKAGMLAVTAHFDRILNQKRFHDDPIYLRLLLLDHQGRIVAQAGRGDAPRGENQDERQYLDPNCGTPRLLVENCRNRLQMLISVALYQTAYAGQLVVWLNRDVIFQRLLKPASNNGDRQYGLSCPMGDFYARAAVFQSDPVEAHHCRQDHAPRAYPLLTSGPVEYKRQGQHLSLRAPIRGTPFSLTLKTRPKGLYGRLPPWHMSAVLGALALTISGGLALLWRVNAKNIMLQTRVVETAKREMAGRRHTALLQAEIKSRRVAEKALEESRQHLDLAIKGADLGVWDWHVPSGKVTFSKRWAEILEYHPTEITPHVDSWETLVHADDLPWVGAKLKAHLAGETLFYETEHRMRTKSGQWKWILDRGMVVERADDGSPLRMAGTQLDVTTRKNAEMALKQYQQNLSRLVEARTRELKATQAKLINKAMEAGRAQLAAMVLHNIGNAVTPITSMLERLATTPLTPIADYLAACHAEIAGRRAGAGDERETKILAYMGELITSLKAVDARQSDCREKIAGSVDYIAEILTMQQGYAASAEEVKSLVDPNQALGDAIRMQTGAIEKRGIRIEQAFAESLPRLLIDKNRLMQVLVNIIKNGYEAIDQNGPQTDKRMRFGTFAEHGRVGFKIEDSGIGLAPEQADAVFEIGHSGKGSSGFGLYYCKMFVEANQGRMTLRSPGKGLGACVAAWFPIARHGS